MNESDVFASTFGIFISRGTSWVNLDDDIRYKARADEFGKRQQARRRITTQSPYYDGTYLIHSVKENVQETLMIQVMGATQNLVTENVLELFELFDQDVYRIRINMGDHRETWTCQPADYAIDRSQVMMHNMIATVTFTIQRLPKVKYEVNI